MIGENDRVRDVRGTGLLLFHQHTDRYTNIFDSIIDIRY